MRIAVYAHALTDRPDLIAHMIDQALPQVTEVRHYMEIDDVMYLVTYDEDHADPVELQIRINALGIDVRLVGDVEDRRPKSI